MLLGAALPVVVIVVIIYQFKRKLRQAQRSAFYRDVYVGFSFGGAS